MGRKKGTKKTGGRKVGTPNRSSIYIRNELADAKINLAASYLKEVEALPPGAPRIAALQSFFKYVFPELKTVESIEDEKTPISSADSPASPTPNPQSLSDEDLEKIASGK